MKSTEIKQEELMLPSFDGTVLSGTLAIPEKIKAIFVPLHGSFVQTRDGDLDGSQKWMFPLDVPKRRIFLDLSHYFIDQGLGSYRYDKRASGKSGGIYKDTDLIILARDAIHVVGEIKKRFSKIPVVVIAQSEGTKVAIRAMELGLKADFLILQGPALDPLKESMEFQRSRAAKLFLDPQASDLRARFPYLCAFYEAFFKGDLLRQVETSQEKYFDLTLSGTSYKCTTSLTKYQQYVWDSSEQLKALKVKTLLLVGSKDANVSPETVAHVQKQKEKGDYQHVTVKILQDLDHSFREISDNENFIDAMAKPLSPMYLNVVQAFLQQEIF